MIGAAALDYALRGWPVFPLLARQKIPATPHGFKDATADADRVDRWWARYPDHNIGLRTGVAFDAWDLDDPDELGPLDYAAVEAVFGPTVRTAKGFHCYVAPTGQGNRARFLPGCDWRGDGGYVVAPPSIHPDGDRYEWVDGFGPDHAVGDAPGWLLERLRPPPPPAPRAAGSPGPPPEAYARRALEAEAGRVLLAPVGQRNDQLNRSAHALGQLVAGGTLTAEPVVDALVAAATRVGLGGREAEQTILSGMRSGMRTPRRPS